MIVIIVILLLSLLFIIVMLFYVYFILSFVLALSCIISCVAATLLYTRFSVILLCFLPSMLYFWKLKNQINIIKKKQHNFAKGKVISKCKNDKPRKKLIGKVLAPLLRRSAPAPCFHPLFSFLDSLHPSGGGT